MRTRQPIQFPRIVFALTLLGLTLPVEAFEGQINLTLTQGAETNALRYTVGSAHLRIEVTSTNWPNPINIVERSSGALTLVFPHNRSFVRLNAAAVTANSGTPGMILPPGIGPQPISSQPAPAAGATMPAIPPGPAIPHMTNGWPPGIGPQPGGAAASGAGLAARPRMPMPPMMNQKLELKATGQTTNLLGFACQQYELQQRGETMEIWATDQLLPYVPYLRSQPHRFSPRLLEEQWPGLVTERQLFPLLARLHYGTSAERLRFEVTAVRTNKIADPDGELFQPPPNYREIQPLPF